MGGILPASSGPREKSQVSRTGRARMPLLSLAFARLSNKLDPMPFLPLPIIVMARSINESLLLASPP